MVKKGGEDEGEEDGEEDGEVTQTPKKCLELPEVSVTE